VVPSANAEPDRYRGRPLLIILENYVLAAIGALDAGTDARLLEVVKKVYGGDDDWRRTMRGVLHLGESIDDSLREMWRRNQVIATEQHVELHPVQFAKMVCDQSFAELIGPSLGQ
jgi:hypothetical protein